MNVKIDTMIRQAVTACQNVMGLKIKHGSWCTLSGSDIISCDPIFAVILYNYGLVFPGAFDPNFDWARPGLVKEACELLDVDPSWLHRFWLGFDRGHQVLLINDKEKTETRDDVSAYGLQLRKEFIG